MLFLNVTAYHQVAPHIGLLDDITHITDTLVQRPDDIHAFLVGSSKEACLCGSYSQVQLIDVLQLLIHLVISFKGVPGYHGLSLGMLSRKVTELPIFSGQPDSICHALAHLTSQGNIRQGIIAFLVKDGLHLIIFLGDLLHHRLDTGIGSQLLIACIFGTHILLMLGDKRLNGRQVMWYHPRPSCMWVCHTHHDCYNEQYLPHCQFSIFNSQLSIIRSLPIL